MSTEYDKGAIARTLEPEKGTWREALRALGGVWFSALSWGFECHDGWREIIESLTEELIAITGGPEACPVIRIVQVKEKLGTLRYYAWHVPEQYREPVFSAVERAESRSASVCEVCGGEGQLGQDRGRLHTACSDHRDAIWWGAARRST